MTGKEGEENAERAGEDGGMFLPKCSELVCSVEPQPALHVDFFSVGRGTYLCARLSPKTHLMFFYFRYMMQSSSLHKLWFTHLSRHSNPTSTSSTSTAAEQQLSFSPCVHTWAQLHQVRQLLRRQGAAAVLPHCFLVQLSSLPSLVVWRPLLQLEHQCS